MSQYDYTYDDRGFIVGEDAVESLYGYAWDDKHDGKHENGRHDDQYPHGGQHTNKHDKDGEYNFQIVETERAFTYDADGKLLTATENEEQQGRYDYEFRYDDMGNRTYYGKSRNGTLQESGEYTYNAANQLTEAKIYDGKKHTTLTYEYDADGNRISENGKIGTDKVENTYIYTVENRLKAVYDADELLAAMAYDGDGNRIFQLNYNLHTDDDWKDNNGNGNGNNKDNTGSGNNGNGNGNSSEASTAETEESQSIAQMLLNVLGLGGEESAAAESVETAEEEAVETAATAAADEETSAAEVSEEPAADAAQEDQLLSIFSGIRELASEAQEEKSEALAALEGITLPETESVPELEGIDIEALSTDKANDNGNNGNNGNGNHYGWDKASDSNAGNNGNNGNGNSGNNGNGNGNSGNNGNGNGNSGNNGNGNSSSDNNGNANGNTNNTGGSQNQSGILFPETGKVSELEQEMIDMIKTEGKHKNYELIEYVNDVNRKYTEVLMELNINGIMDTAYSYGNERLTVERFDGWTGYYTYDPRGSVSGVTGADGYLWQSYRYDAYGNITFGAPQYNNEYTYNAESYNPNLDVQYLRARYYSPSTANFLTEDSYLGDINDPLTLNRYNYVKSSPLNYVDPEGELPQVVIGAIGGFVYSGVGSIIGQTLSGDISWTRVFVDALSGAIGGAVTSLAGFKVGRAVEGAISETADYVLTQLENGRKVSIAGVISNMLTGAAFESVSDSLQPIVAGIDSFLESFLNGEDVSDSLKSGLFTGVTAKLTKTLAKGLEEVSSLLEFGECTETLHMSDASISKEAAEEIQDSSMTSINKTVKKQGDEVTEEMVDEIEESIARKSNGGSGTASNNKIANPDYFVAEDGTVIPFNKVKQNSQYDRLEIEIKSGKAVRPQNAVNDWDDFLGPNQTDIDPFSGQKSQDRIWSEDGKRSIRFGEHEMDSMGTARFHYHKETWYEDYTINELQRVQKQ